MITIDDIVDFLRKLCDNAKEGEYYHFPDPVVCKKCENKKLCDQLTITAGKIYEVFGKDV